MCDIKFSSFITITSSRGMDVNRSNHSRLPSHPAAGRRRQRISCIRRRKLHRHNHRQYQYQPILLSRFFVEHRFTTRPPSRITISPTVTSMTVVLTLFHSCAWRHKLWFLEKQRSQFRKRISSLSLPLFQMNRSCLAFPPPPMLDTSLPRK